MSERPVVTPRATLLRGLSGLATACAQPEIARQPAAEVHLAAQARIIELLLTFLGDGEISRAVQSVLDAVPPSSANEGHQKGLPRPERDRP